MTDSVAAARHPELAVLSAIAHGSAHPDVLDVLPTAFAALDVDHAALYCDIVLDLLPQAARNHLEALVRAGTYEYRSDVARDYAAARGQAEGQAQGRAEAVLAVLATRRIEVPEPARQRITGCTDLEQLDAWVRHAVTARSVEELFG